MVPDPDGACTGKHPFASARDAHAALRNHERRGRRMLNVYRCPLCNDFHIGAKKPRPPKPKQRRSEGWA